MTTYTAAEVNAWYQAIDNLPTSATLPNGELAVYVASLNSGALSPLQVQAALESSKFTLNVVDKVIREYVAAFGSVPSQADLAKYVAYASKSAAALAHVPALLANTAAFEARYGANAHTVVGAALGTALYTNAFGTAPSATWLAHYEGLTVAVVLNAIANSAAYKADVATAITAFQNAEITGTEQTTGGLQVGGSLFQLTTGLDSSVANLGAFATHSLVGNSNQIYGSFGGAGATFNAGDQIIGAAGSTGNTLTLTDNLTGGTGNLSYIPATVENISNLNVYSGEAVQINTVTGPEGFTGLTQLTVYSATTDGSSDSSYFTSSIDVAATTNVTVTDAGGYYSYLDVDGGKNILVNETGEASVYVGYNTAPVGTVTVNDTSTDYGYVEVDGGTNVTVNTAASDGDVYVGYYTAPTGTVTVNATGTGDVFIDVNGGTTVTITTSAGGDVYVGTNYDGDYTGATSTGTVTVTDTSGVDSTIWIDGGVGAGSTAGTAAVYVQASGQDVVIGYDYENSPAIGVVPTGTVVVNDTAKYAYDGILNDTDAYVDILGGTTVNVTTNSGSVVIGEELAAPDAGANPTGNVTVIDTATNLGFDDVGVAVYGGANISITAASGTIYVGDGSVASNPTGTVTITLAGVNTGDAQGSIVNENYNSSIYVSGGTAVTINTTGSEYIDVGSSNTPVTGAVIINDTFSGVSVNGDNVDVLGGTTVTVNVTATDGDIYVGQAATLNATSTAVSNGAADATGAVVINNISGTTYGTADVEVYTNGSTSVSVTGANSVSITDVQSTVGSSNTAVGVNTLATVSLTSVGDTDITSNALVTLSLTNSEDTVTLVQTPANSAGANATALALTVSNVDTEIDASEAASYTSISVATSGTAADYLELDLAKVTSLSFSNAAALDVDITGAAVLATITATGSGLLDLGDVSGLDKLTTITATAATGGVEVEINPGNTSFAGAGNDVVVIDQAAQNFGAGVVISGGGNSTLYADFVGTDTTDVALGGGLGGSNGFSSLGVAALDNNAAGGSFSAAGFTNLIVGGYDLPGHSGFDGVGATVTFDNVKVGTTLDLIDTNGYAVTYNLATAPATPVSVALTVGLDGATSATGTGDASFEVILTGANDSISTLSINSQGYTDAGANENSLDVLTTTVTTVTITGDQSLDLGVGATVADIIAPNDTGAGTVTTINASTSTGAVVDVYTVDIAKTGVTVTGGSGEIIAAGYDGQTAASNLNAVDTFNVGKGGGEIYLGEGGAGYNAGVSSSTGSETVNLTATAAVGTTIYSSVNIDGATNGTFGIVNNWSFGTIGSGQTADSLDFQNGPIVIANGTNVQGNAAAHGFAGEYYTISNGVITLGALSPTVSGAQELSDAQYIVDQGVVGTIASVTIPVNGGVATYVIENEGGGAKDLFIKLNGVSGVTGFGSIADWSNPADAANIGAGTSITLSGFTNYDTAFANVTATLGTQLATANGTFNDSGFALANLATTGSGFTYTFNNLGNFGILQTDTTGGGNVVVTQVGVDPVLTVSATGDTEINNLTFGNSSIAKDDPTLLLYSYGGDLDINGSVIDATNSASTVLISGGYEVTVSGITDTALKTVDAHELDGILTLTAAQSGLTITGSLYGDLITAVGAGDTINVGTDASAAAEALVQISASGATDHITVVSDSYEVTINASGNNDVITIVGAGPDSTLGGTIAAPHPSITSVANLFQLGANDVINVGDNTWDGATYVSAWVGSNATVNLAYEANAYIYVDGDVTGALSSGSYAKTAINLTTNATLSDLQVNMEQTVLDNGAVTYTGDSAYQSSFQGWAGGTAHHSFVNVATATSLAQALDIAAAQALVLSQQFDNGIGTHVVSNSVTSVLVENVSSGLADWFQYGGNTYIVEAINTGSAAAHTALGTHDIVIELTGLGHQVLHSGNLVWSQST